MSRPQALRPEPSSCSASLLNTRAVNELVVAVAGRYDALFRDASDIHDIGPDMQNIVRSCANGDSFATLDRTAKRPVEVKPRNRALGDMQPPPCTQ
jgi:hypothetical protein